MKLREHRGALDDSMETVVEIEPTAEALVGQVNKVLARYGKTFTPADLKVEPYGYDDRIEWNTHIVVIEGYGVFGFTDGPLKA